MPITLTRDRLQDLVRQVQRGHTRPFIETLFTIPSKRNEVVPFRYNRLQRYHEEHETGRDYEIKYRQGGSSVRQIAKRVARAICIPYYNAAMVTLSTDNGRTADQFFNHVEGFIERLPPEIRPRIKHQTSSYIEFDAPIYSQIWVGKVGSGEFGRSLTIHDLLVTELGSFSVKEANSVLQAATESVPPDGLITWETTPKLVGSPAHILYVDSKQGRKPYKAIFAPWWFSEDYHLPRGHMAALAQDKDAIVFTEEEERLAARFLDDDGIPKEDRIRWRRAKIADRGRDFPAEYPEDEIGCWVAATIPVFKTERLRQMMEERRNPIAVYGAEDLVKVYKEFQPGRSYVIGVDGSSGTADDPCAAEVQCIQTGEVAAVLSGYLTPRYMAHELIKLGGLYERAMIGGERDAYTLEVMEELIEQGYPNVYFDYDDGKMGFPNTNSSRAAAVTELADAVRDGDMLVYDEETLAELFQYQRRSQAGGLAKFSAPDGMHDDRCVALQRAQQMRNRVPAHFSAVGGGQGGIEVPEFPSGLYV